MGIRKRADKWLVTVELGRDETGRRRRHCSTHDTEGEAKNAEAIARGEVAKGEWFDETNLLTGAFLEGWLELRRPHIEASTYDMWSDFIRVHMIPAFGRVPVAKLRKVRLDHYEAQLLASGRRPLNRRRVKAGEKRPEPIIGARPGLSPTTVKKHRTMLRYALDYAVASDLIRRNPTAGMGRISDDEQEIRWLELGEQDRLLRIAGLPRSKKNPRPSELYLPIIAALGTGMRRGELLALRESDLDFAHDRIAARRGRQDNRDGRVTYRAGGKNGKGRVVTAPRTLMDMLAARLRENAARRDTAGEDWQGEGLIFCGAFGEPVGIHRFKSAWRRLVVKAELPGVRFHDLRHTHATELLRAGVHPKIVSERLGHSSVKITLDRYSHVIPDLQTEAAEKTDLVLRGLLSPKCSTAL